MLPENKQPSTTTQKNAKYTVEENFFGKEQMKFKILKREYIDYAKQKNNKLVPKHEWLYDCVYENGRFVRYYESRIDKDFKQEKINVQN